MEWLTESQGCEHVGRSSDTLQRWRRTGDITAYPQGPGRLMYRRIDLESVVQLQQLRYRERPLLGRPRAMS